ncbi:hypothetical protein PHSY_007016 [Pseudozyma hubeiensis SY62]|uniref:Uncharacterized protein n=1 Tax=Pseudozyma hubeiensis (strain SY62) TaxID=1305764 RepID=R9PMT8_PSEHS|nr:hypothetical protein PHSY_007016 [Pseudozyma hubeiensis SY62]GAC99415.1 hypothetical protein PHSY_007016 [Pseudozyma hubeiensis SY62]
MAKRTLLVIGDDGQANTDDESSKRAFSDTIVEERSQNQKLGCRARNFNRPENRGLFHSDTRQTHLSLIIAATPLESLKQPRLVKIVQRVYDPPTAHKAYRFVSSLRRRGEEELAGKAKDLIEHFEGAADQAGRGAKPEVESIVRNPGVGPGSPKTVTFYQNPEQVRNIQHSEVLRGAGSGSHGDEVPIYREPRVKILSPSYPEPRPPSFTEFSPVWQDHQRALERDQRMIENLNSDVYRGHARISENSNHIKNLKLANQDLEAQLKAANQRQRGRKMLMYTALGTSAVTAGTGAVYQAMSSKKNQEQDGAIDGLQQEVARLRALNAQRMPTSINGPDVAGQGVPALNGQTFQPTVPAGQAAGGSAGLV